MFRRLLLLLSFISVVASWCTPFLACNQTIYGDFSDVENNMKIVILGRPFQKYDELLVTGEFYNNGSDVMDDATFTVGLSKGIIMHQLIDDVEDYLITATMGTDDNGMNVTGLVAGKGRNLYGTKELPTGNFSCEASSVTFRIKSQDGFGFAFGNEYKFTGQASSQYPKKDRGQSAFVGGQFRTTKMELKCLDEDQ